MTADLNIKVASPHRGNGYGKKALLLFLDFFFNEAGGQILQDKLGIRNFQGRDFLVDCGFVSDPSYEGVHFLWLSKERFYKLHKSS
jgi:RimJ/RimL family protein N-acetyltransferase